MSEGGVSPQFSKVREMPTPSLNNMHLAELHRLAAKEGVEGFRMLTRQELIEALGGEASEPESDDRSGDSGRGQRDGRRGRGRGGRGGRDRGRDSGRDRDEVDDDDDHGEPIEGVLEITSRGHGFISPEGPDAGDEDIYVSPSQIRRCELEAGDVVAGPARKPRRGERHPALVHVDKVNGADPGAERTKFEELEAVAPNRRLSLAGEKASDEDKLLLRSIDLLTPLARGQRVLVNATRGSGRTTLLRALAAELGKVEDLEVIVALIDERPEEETSWRELASGTELEIAGADMRPGEQLRVIELAVAKAKRKAESGADVALIIDSLSRLAVAADDPGAAKPIFGAGRETDGDESGSLTVIATALTGEDDGGVARALATTENSLITLDGDLSAAGVYPAIVVAECRVTGEEKLRSEAELTAARALRSKLAELSPREAAEHLAERIAATPDNEALLSSQDG